MDRKISGNGATAGGAFTLTGAVAPGVAVAPADIRRTKRALSWLGLYKPPAWGITGIVDSALFDGVRAFQAGRGLSADGVMRPGGPTARVLGAALKATPAGRAGATSAAPKKPVNLLAETRPKPRADGMRTLPYRPGVERAPEKMPAPHRPGKVWENGRWRPETPAERAAPKIVPMAQKAAAVPAPAKPSEQGRDSYHKGTAYIVPSPNNDEPIDVAQAYKALGFDSNGLPQWMEALRWASANEMLTESSVKNVLNAPSFTDAGLALIPIAKRAKKLSVDAQETASKVEGPEFDPPEGGIAGTDDARDAFRHALWSYLMTRELGEEAAKGFGDAHEISVPNREGIQIMDLHNNHVGRLLALDPANKSRDPIEVVREALMQGRLRTKPFKVPQ